MSVKIHPTAIVSASARLEEGVDIGPYCCIGDKVSLKKGVKLISHVVLDGNTEIGENTTIYPFAAIGLPPQDLKFKGENSSLVIGKNNIIREYVTMQPGTEKGGLVTRVGDHGLFMAGTHIAHDCQIGNYVVMANNATLAGHVTIGDHATIGGLVAVHQFVRIGHHAFIGGMAGVKYDIIPYALVMGRAGNLEGINIVGLKRQEVGREEIETLLKMYKDLFSQNEASTIAERTERVEKMYADHSRAMEIISFIKEGNARGLCLPSAA